MQLLGFRVQSGSASMLLFWEGKMSSVSLVVEPSKIIFRMCKILDPKGGYNLTIYCVP